MNKKIEKILDIWHNYFKLEDNQYPEFEPSDIEYFISCMLYNHFLFTNALDTMKTIDLSYDFLKCCGEDEYNEVKHIISTINISDEEEKILFLKEFIKNSQEKYTKDELYLLDRLNYHIDSLYDRYKTDTKADKVIFEKPIKSRNPLL